MTGSPRRSAPCAASALREYNLPVPATASDPTEAASGGRWPRGDAAARRDGGGRARGWMRLVVAVAVVLALSGCGGDEAPSDRPAGTHPRRVRPAPRTDRAAGAARANVPVLCWHQIREPTSADGAEARPYIVGPRRLAEQLDALDRTGFTPVGGDALVSHVLRGTPLPRKPVLLTFDDGSAGQYT